MTKLETLKQMLSEIKARVDAFEKDVSADFNKVIVDGVEYYDTKLMYTHQEALDLAAKHGLRVLESWEMHKLWIESGKFRKSLETKWYWSFSMFSNAHVGAWRFDGDNGAVNFNARNDIYGARCVAKEIGEGK